MTWLKFLKLGTPEKFAVNILKLELYRVMGPKDADGMANSVDPDQTAPPLGGSVVMIRFTIFFS